MTTYGKIWGETRPIEINNNTELHRITIKSGSFCSTHKHEHKWNGFFIEKGTLEIHSWKNDYDLVDITVLKAGGYTTVPPGEFHKFVCIEDCICFELYWPAELSPQDIKRKDVGGTQAQDEGNLKKDT